MTMILHEMLTMVDWCFYGNQNDSFLSEGMATATKASGNEVVVFFLIEEKKQGIEADNQKDVFHYVYMLYTPRKIASRMEPPLKAVSSCRAGCPVTDVTIPQP